MALIIFTAFIFLKCIIHVHVRCYSCRHSTLLFLQCVFGVDNFIIKALDVTSNRNMIFPKQHNYHPDFLSELMYFTLSLE